MALADIAADLVAAADHLAVRLSALTPEGSSRTATFPWGERDALAMARNSIHELVHHLMDVRRSLH
jgi:hypothetical protein